MHPITQLGMGVAALNHDSVFAAAYEKGIKKTDYWTYTYEDSISLLAKLPALAARIYRNIYKAGEELPGVRKDLDYAGEHICKSTHSSLAETGDQQTTPTCSAMEITRT
jgi:citrate synthase